MTPPLQSQTPPHSIPLSSPNPIPGVGVGLSLLPPELLTILRDLLATAGRLAAAAPVPLDVWRDAYLADLATRTVPSYQSRVRQALRETRELAGPHATTASLTPELVARLARYRPRAPETTNGLLRSLRAGCTYAIERGWLDRSPFSRKTPWAVPGLDPSEPHHARPAVATVLAHLARDKSWDGRRLHALAAVYAYAGLRRNEALWLRTTDVDLTASLVWVIPIEARGLKTRPSAGAVPMPAALTAILADWLPRTRCGWLFPRLDRKGPWHGGTAKRRPTGRLVAAAKAAGVEGFTPRSLRATLATHLGGDHGLTPRQLQQVLRHSTTAMQKRYVRRELTGLVRAVAGFAY